MPGKSKSKRSESDIGDLDSYTVVDGVEDENKDKTIKTVTYGEDISPAKAFEKKLDGKIRLERYEMIDLKSLIDKEINPNFIPTPIEELPKFQVTNLKDLQIDPNDKNYPGIYVTVEKIDDRVLVKVGPCDLSGVGGHKIREKIIEELVNEALKTKGYDTQLINFSNVNVSACVGVRGRAQMFFRLFTSSSKGSHMNAYVKTQNETHLTHWEPRKGPQSFFNDTICAMVTSVATSLFEKGIREDTIHSSEDATKNILKNPTLREIFDAVLEKTIDRIVSLVADVTNKVNDLMQPPKAQL